MNIAKCLSTTFYIETSRSLYFSQTLCDGRIVVCIRYKIDIFHVSCAIALFSFITLVLQSEVQCYIVYILFLYQNFS